MTNKANELRKMSANIVAVAMTVQHLPNDLVAEIHKLCNECEMLADELEGKKTSLVVTRRKG